MNKKILLIAVSAAFFASPSFLSFLKKMDNDLISAKNN